MAAFKEIDRMVDQGWPRNMIAESLEKMKFTDKGEVKKAEASVFKEFLQELLGKIVEGQLDAQKDRKALIGLLRHQQEYDRSQDERIDRVFEEIRLLQKLERMLDNHRIVEEKLREKLEAAEEEAHHLKEELDKLTSESKRGFWSKFFGK